MNDTPEDFERRRLQQRLVELRNQVHDISGGEAQFGPAGDGLSLEQEIEFLERIVAFETAPRITWLERLKSAGYDMPDPATLSNEEIGLEVWQVIQRLSELRAFLYQTDHLSDRELYEHLYRDTLSAETLDFPPDPDSACHLDLIGSGSEEDIACWLRYYADEEEREDWLEQFPEDPLPPREKPPHDRDRLLPKRDYPESPLVEILDWLLGADWEDADGPIRLAADLADTEVIHVPFFVASRALLVGLRDGGPVKATAKLGNLPRALIKQVFPHLPYTEEKRSLLCAINKVFDEMDLHLLHAVRITCQTAGLLRKHKGCFGITRMGSDLLDPARSGELFRKLFCTFFRKINLAHFDCIPELDGIQQTLTVILWRLAFIAGEWTPLTELMDQTLLPELLDEVAEYEDRPYSTPGGTVEIRLWRHLVDFGLLEAGPEISGLLPDAYRITPLYDRFIHFPLQSGKC
jgi:hypothetical protein